MVLVDPECGRLFQTPRPGRRMGASFLLVDGDCYASGGRFGDGRSRRYRGIPGAADVHPERTRMRSGGGRSTGGDRSQWRLGYAETICETVFDVSRERERLCVVRVERAHWSVERESLLWGGQYSIFIRDCVIICCYDIPFFPYFRAIVCRAIDCVGVSSFTPVPISHSISRSIL